MSTLVVTSYQGTPSLGTNIFVQIRNPATGVVVSARTNTGVREDVAGSGFYSWSGTLSDLTAYEAIWDEAATVYAGEVVIPQSTATGGGGGGGVIALATTAPATVNPLVFTIKRNDTDPSIAIQALVPNPVDPASFIPWPVPSGATVKFTMRDNADIAGGTRTTFPSGAPKVHATATVDDAANGLMSYGWIAADTDTDGIFRGEFEVTTLTGEIRTFPVGADASRNWIQITITDDLDPGITP